MGLLLRGVLVIALFAGLLLLGSYYLASSCTIGFAGNAASVTATGMDAAGWCRSQVRTTLGSAGAYSSDERKNDILVCRYLIADLTYTVRDQGTLFAGRTLCSYFKTLSEGGRPAAPTPILEPR